MPPNARVPTDPDVVAPWRLEEQAAGSYPWRHITRRVRKNPRILRTEWVAGVIRAGEGMGVVVRQVVPGVDPGVLLMNGPTV